MRLASSLSLILLSGGGLAAAQERPEIPATLSLRQAVSIALAQSTTLRSAQWRLKQVEGRGEQARAPLLPQVTLGGYQTDQTTNLRAMGIEAPILPVKVGPFPSMDFRGTVTQDLFNYQSIQNHKAAQERTNGSRQQVVNAREAVVLATVSAYLQAQRSKASRDTTAEQLGLAQKLEQITRDRYEHGISSALDLNRARQQVNSLQQTLYQSENALTAAKLQLANVIHARVTSSFDVEELAASAAPAIDGSQAVRQALESRPDYRAAESQVRAAERQLSAIRASRLPVIQFRGDFGQSGRTPFENLSTFHVQGSISLPLFTGGRIAGQVTEADGQLQEARVSLEEIHSQVETDVLTAVAAVESAARELQVARQNVQLAHEEVALATERLTSGVADNTEVVNAQDRLARSEDTRIRAGYSLEVARANLERATGAAEKAYTK